MTERICGLNLSRSLGLGEKIGTFTLAAEYGPVGGIPYSSTADYGGLGRRGLPARHCEELMRRHREPRNTDSINGVECAEEIGFSMISVVDKVVSEFLDRIETETETSIGAELD